VDDFSEEKFRLIAPTLPDGHKSTAHLSVSDASGDSAILEYIDGRLNIHHSRDYKVRWLRVRVRVRVRVVGVWWWGKRKRDSASI